MSRNWSILLLAALAILLLETPSANGASASIEVEDDEYYISVDPSDEDQGYLEITGSVDGRQLGLLDQLTVMLDVNISEVYDDEPTGRFWAVSVEFDDETVTPEETRLTYNKGSADFKILISPELEGQGDGDIAVPPGISPLTEGKLVLSMTYTGASSGNDIQRMTIIPEYYHLINISTPLAPLEVRAGNKVNYTFRIKNAGNEIDSVTVEAPKLEELIEQGWTASLSLTDIDDMEPGEEVRPVLLMQAPDEILYDSTLEIDVRVYTDAIDPVSEEPAGSDELTLTLQLIRSKVEEPVIPDDDDDDDDDVIQATDSPYAIIGVTAGMAILALIVIIVLFVNKGGGDNSGGDQDMHNGMVRI